MDPQQELFMALRNAFMALGLCVFDGALPDAKTPYPFVYLGETTEDDTQTKSAYHGDVLQMVHIFNTYDKRGTTSKILLKLKHQAHQIEETPNFHWTLRGINMRILPDNTTSVPLQHGVLELRYHFS